MFLVVGFRQGVQFDVDGRTVQNGRIEQRDVAALEAQGHRLVQHVWREPSLEDLSVADKRALAAAEKERRLNLAALRATVDNLLKPLRKSERARAFFDDP